MEIKNASSFKEYLDIIDSLATTAKDITLFRGQNDAYPLLPTIARKDKCIDTTSKEKDMLGELRRRTQFILGKDIVRDWDLLVYAQHFGMKTRLLDWTSNPLTALWFACSSAYKEFVYVYVLLANNTMIADTESTSPFNQTSTSILKPALNNERIIAQSGWFTAHKFSKAEKCFVELELNHKIKEDIVQIRIPTSVVSTDRIFERLSTFGINNQSLFPDITGVCTHLNWSYNA